MKDYSQTTSEEFKEPSIKGNNKLDHDLYHDEDDVVKPVIRVKRISMSKEEKWKIMEDSKIVFTIDGSKISKKEREFLKTIEGFNFILSESKQGIKSLNNFRSKLKKIIDA